MSAGTRWVELADLLCPGCREQVSPEPPIAAPGEGWSHQDGSPLCMGGGGGLVEPIEWPRPTDESR